MDDGRANPFVILANNAVDSGAWKGIGNVRVLNLSRGAGNSYQEAQDQLTLVPEPASMALLALGAGVAVARRRRTRTRRVSAARAAEAALGDPRRGQIPGKRAGARSTDRAHPGDNARLMTTHVPPHLHRRPRRCRAADARTGQAAGAQAGTPLLPIRTPKIDHLDVIVPNVEASARFYMGVFNTTLHAQPFQGGFRYFVLFGDLPANRQVGYLAIGDSRGRGTYIGHFCTSVARLPPRQRGDHGGARPRPPKRPAWASSPAAAASAASSPIPTASRSSSCPRPIRW